MTHAIEAHGLTKRFGDTLALDNVDLQVGRGSVLGLLGPNGAGTTTAVRILATLLRADAGSALVGGLDMRKNAHRVRQSIGLTGQYASVDEDLTGTQNLVLIGSLLNLSSREARHRAAELLEWFDLAEAAGRTAKTYSGGMRRRLDLAAGLVGRPSVMFLDEPTTGLDAAAHPETEASGQLSPPQRRTLRVGRRVRGLRGCTGRPAVRGDGVVAGDPEPPRDVGGCTHPDPRS
jgi:oleandomycin transport system ATP-binding protein